MSVQVNNQEYKSAAEALRVYAEPIVAGTNIRVEDTEEGFNGDTSYFQIDNGKFMCIKYDFTTIQRYFKQIGMDLTRDLTIISDDVVVEPNNTKIISRPIPSANKRIISEEAETSEFVGKSYDNQLRRYNIHHIIPYMNAKDIEGYIHNPDNLIALDHNNHDIMHHGRVNEVIILLSKIFEAYPAKLAFIEAQGYNISEVAELSLSTHK